MRDQDKIFIDGAWVPSEGTGTIEVVNASTEEVMGHIPEGTAGDVDKAVAAAKRAFESWSTQPVDERLKYVQRLAEELNARNEEIATIIAGEVGMPINFAKMIQAGLPAATTASVIETAKNFAWEEQIGNSLVVREPIGVVGCITPWNYPLHQIMAKVAPALAAGNTVVLKPSEVAPLNAFVLAQIFEDIGLPAGVFNLVTGTGPVVGEAIAAHPDVDMVSFTGSTRAGKRVMQVGAETVKKIHLELGGKSANIILDDADFAEVIPKGVFACYLNSGQTCTAHTRMLVPKDRMDEAAQIAAQAAAGFPLGAADSEASMLGPLVSKAQQDRVRDYIRKGIEEGATLVTGGPDQPEGLDKGYFVQPTVFANVTNDMTIAQEEIFGPVLSIIGYEDEDDAVRIANDTIYGLAGGVWSADPERAKAVARRMRTGQVDVNGGSFNAVAPFGGYKQSGIGRELGSFGFEEFLEVKSLQL
ncbi:aldehyde dehydrogenase family protein [Actinomarinicola tropica]|uniref:Aldehyde dehydrogenase family protein n=1 Tax=Actinomarinicola tropica TaxID=2789776 RepID=A0A5Q2RHW5_9ACTN|nr:aldehyde dehydrogenase family protein [Actinomarinicola tropica]QGG93936.1 aldehyde dehydrogenase family protein [Actinomarinicola tropica]